VVFWEGRVELRVVLNYAREESDKDWPRLNSVCQTLGLNRLLISNKLWMEEKKSNIISSWQHFIDMLYDAVWSIGVYKREGGVK
jgi:hypothetical protein